MSEAPDEPLVSLTTYSDRIEAYAKDYPRNYQGWSSDTKRTSSIDTRNAFVFEESRDSDGVLARSGTNGELAHSNPSGSVSPSSTEASKECPQIVIDVFGNSSKPACAIAYCESQYRVSVIGDSGNALGLFQIWPRFHQARADAIFGAGANLLDLEVNVRTAYVISSGGTDWSQWTCRFVL